MEIKSLYRAGTQSVERSLPVLAWDLTGAHEWLECCGKKATCNQIKHREPPSRREAPHEAPESIIQHRGRCNLPATARMNRDELVSPAEIVLKAREQMSLSMPSARRSEQDTMAGCLDRLVEKTTQFFKTSRIHRRRMAVREFSEGFEKELKGWYAGHA